MINDHTIIKVIVKLDQSNFAKYQFLESRVVDVEEETYVEVTELRMADV